MPRRYLKEQNSVEVSNDTVSKSLDIEEEDELLQIFLNSSLDTAAEERKLALFGPKPVTLWPRSLQFESLTHEKPNPTPVILLALLEAMDGVVPPVDKILNGLTEESMRNCDSLLGHLVNDVGKTNKVLCDHLLSSLSPGELAQMLQLLFLRFERPVFEALPEMCQFIHRRIFYMDPRMSRCRAKNNIVFTKGGKLVQQCIDRMSTHQRAILATFLKYCQRWCQAHVGSKMREDCQRNSVSEYTEAISCLSGLFCGSLIGIPRAYISASFRSDDSGSVNALKRDVFNFLLTMTSTELWHSISFHQLVEIDEEKVPTKDITEVKDEGAKEGPNAKSIKHTISNSAPQKTKSFNWI
ncbi:unnamed protein product [Schistocephalus solidus]|uniref:Fanconi anemia group D2 protein n=1 Tax=Schistocephalus solidus TaxID=70667 RepID=A0A0V0J324_SCHSO|nr:unnamed protein product [Schistocephalus solidus]